MTTWRELFDRSADYEGSVEDVRAALTDHRERDDE